jgi:hypothetical protein
MRKSMNACVARYVVLAIAIAGAATNVAVVGLVSQAPPAFAVTNCVTSGTETDCVTATPDAATNPVGTTHTVNTKGTSNDPSGVTVCFPVGTVVPAVATITSGPNAPQVINFSITVTVATFAECDFAGSFSYTDKPGGAGTDTITTGGFLAVTVTKTWLCPPGQTISGTACVSAPVPPTPPAPACPAGQQLVSGQCVTPFAGFAFALGGGPGTTGPADLAPDTTSPDNTTATSDDGPPFPSRSRDDGTDPLIDDLAGP